MSKRVNSEYEVIVIGAGQAGLALSYLLSKHGRKYIVLERARIAESWRSRRWDSFTLVTPNGLSLNFPDLPYQGDDPDGFVGRDELIRYFEKYASSFDVRVQCGVAVTRVGVGPGGAGFAIDTENVTYLTPNVVVATGILQEPRIPGLSRQLPDDLYQLHSAEYRRPELLPDGAVLVVGTGQSGCQIAEELNRHGRKVYLSVGSNGRVPRRYRGQDVYYWTGKGDINTRVPDAFSQHAHVSGANGGHDINLYQFARDGITLLGHLDGVDGETLVLSDDLVERLTRADEFEAAWMRATDAYIAREGIDAPQEPVDEQMQARNRYEGEIITRLNCRDAGISSVLWATGYGYNFDWVDFPVFDEEGFPRQSRGVTDIPGLYFLGMNWRDIPRSAFVGSVGKEAVVVADHIASRDA